MSDLVERVRARLATAGLPPTESSVLAALRDEQAWLSQEAVLGLAQRLRADLVGAGPLEPLLADPAVTDVVVNGPDAVFVDRGQGLERVSVCFPDRDAIRALAVRFATACGRRLDEAMPWVDATMPGGVRLHAVIPPVAPEGPLLSLRVLGRRARPLGELVDAGTIPRALLPWLVRLVERRISFLVTGGTGAGKTTLLAALLSLVPRQERIVLVEDTEELRPQHPHVARLVARVANVEGAGAVGLDVLVRQALRMRPDRLVVGEVRGAEVVDLLAALNTGHEGGCGTVHANSPRDVPARLEALGVAAGLDRSAVHSQVAAGLRAVVHVTRDGATRRVSEIGLVSRVGEAVHVVPALVTKGSDASRGPASPELETLLGGAPG